MNAGRAREPQFVFGYGSLVAGHERGEVAILRGYRRTWGVAMDNSRDEPGYKYYRLRRDASRPAVFVAFLDIEPDPACAVTGICLPAGDRELRALDRRERNYRRIDVSAAIEDAPGLVWVYSGSEAGRARLRDGRSRGAAVVGRDYLDAVLAALAALAPGEAVAVQRSLGGLTSLDLDRVEL